MSKKQISQQNDSQGMEYLQRLPNEQSFSLKSLPSQKSKTYSKLQPNRNFSCIYIHQNKLYLGTKNSKLYIYDIRLNKKFHQNQQDDFILKQIKVITPQCKVVSMVKANDKYFVTVPEADDQCFISLWSAQTQNFLVCLQGHKSQISSLIFMQNQTYLVSASWDATIRIWNLQKLESLKPFKTYKGNYPILVIKQFNDEVLMLGGDDCYLVLWNWKKGEVIKKEFGHAGSVTFINTMNEYIFTCGGDNKFRFWDILVAEPTQTSIQSAIDFKQKYKIKKVAEIKDQYDSVVQGTYYDNFLIVIDRRGELFCFSQDTQIYKMGNYFDENQQISGVDVYGDFIMVTTTKGILKHINMKKEFNKMTCSIKTKKTIASTQNIIKIQSKLIPQKNGTSNQISNKKDKKQKSQIESISSHSDKQSNRQIKSETKKQHRNESQISNKTDPDIHQ